MVEGTFARVFRSGLTPLEIAQRITRLMDSKRSVGVSGEAVAPNYYDVFVSPEDHSRFVDVATTLTTELEDAIREHASDEGYSFMGPVEVQLRRADSYATGTFEVTSKLHEGPTGRPPGSLILPGERRIRLGEKALTVGRTNDNDLVLADPNVSRNHAEIRPVPGAYQLVDLGSTNGTKINGTMSAEHRLVNGDVITFGATVVTFEAS